MAGWMKGEAGPLCAPCLGRACPILPATAHCPPLLLFVAYWLAVAV